MSATVNPARPGRHVLVVRLDSLGDMIICGPAVRAVAASADRVSVLAGPGGAAAAALLPGVDDVVVWNCPWISPPGTSFGADPSAAADPPSTVIAGAIADAVAAVAALDVDEALILTSFHQSALPTALTLRLAGVSRIAAISTDYPGRLLDVRVPEPPDAPEPVRMLAVAEAAGYARRPGDDGALALRADLIDRAEPVGLPDGPFVIVHPGVSAPARAYPVESFAAVVAGLTENHRNVVVTGSADEVDLTAQVAAGVRSPGRAVDLGGALDLAALAATLRRAEAVVVANTGPAHVAAAVGTPVVSLFAPVVPAGRWAPFVDPRVVLGDQDAACRDSRARSCPVPGHPCLSGVTAAEVVAAVDRLCGRPDVRSTGSRPVGALGAVVRS
ncbi:MAG: glycosyltransferase family 9 protein [bacterium]